MPVQHLGTAKNLISPQLLMALGQARAQTVQGERQLGLQRARNWQDRLREQNLNRQRQQQLQLERDRLAASRARDARAAQMQQHRFQYDVAKDRQQQLREQQLEMQRQQEAERQQEAAKRQAQITNRPEGLYPGEGGWREADPNVVGDRVRWILGEIREEDPAQRQVMAAALARQAYRTGFAQEWEKRNPGRKFVEDVIESALQGHERERRAEEPPKTDYSDPRIAVQEALNLTRKLEDVPLHQLAREAQRIKMQAHALGITKGLKRINHDFGKGYVDPLVKKRREYAKQQREAEEEERKTRREQERQEKKSEAKQKVVRKRYATVLENIEYGENDIPWQDLTEMQKKAVRYFDLDWPGRPGQSRSTRKPAPGGQSDEDLSDPARNNLFGY